ncbi:MAG: NifB/NifX family molybdenum-iron cluster-binding protein [Methanomassiliicoccaceae archaeon]|nr:NifB/NifX family molybdenum-iron cluster-binding protein [Methanomassiliicoccaceae archaeon]
MRIGVIAEGDSLESYVADDFGHAPFFLIVDMDTLDYQVVVNEYADSMGAGMKVADAIVGLGVDAVITGGIGSHGLDILNKAGIHVAYDEEGTVEECIRDFKRRYELRKQMSD